MTQTSRFKLGIDIGGTFTDLTLLEDNGARVHTHKLSSTPEAPSRAVARGVVELMTRIGRTPADIDGFVHGTTIALNAILERRGARVAMLVTEGNRDILEIARMQKHDQFNLLAAEPAGLVPRRRVVEIAERTDKNGVPVRDVDPVALQKALEALAGENVESLAVCLLNAHANPQHEIDATGIAGRALPGRHVSRSTALWPEIREYERGMVAVLNAYVQPVMSGYVSALEQDAKAMGLAAKLYITQSNGGIMSASTAKSEPVRTLLSGPASGVVGAAYIARLAGSREGVTIDIGGTSADVSLIRDGEPEHSTEAMVGDFPVVMPSVDVFAVGAGGGSIAWFDSVGLLKVGPRSAGAAPGPACYGKGGAEATVTDAYVVSGFIDPDNFLGGSMKLDRKLAEQAVAKIAQRLGGTLEEAAEAILKIATSNMITALLPMMTKRGVDPRDFALIPFGGAGATHACLIAEEIIIPRIVVPPSPGTTCALGAAIADVRADTIRSLRRELALIPSAEIQSVFGELEASSRAWLAAENPVIAGVQIRRSIDARYAGQAFDIEVDLSDAPDRITPELIAGRFHDTYETLYRNSDRKARIDLINVRVRIIGKTPELELKRLPAAAARTPVPKAHRDIWYGGRRHKAELHDRTALASGHVLEGPAIIEQFDTTTVVAPGFSASTDDYGILTLARSRPEAA